MPPRNEIQIPIDYAGNPEAESNSGDLGEAAEAPADPPPRGVPGTPVTPGSDNDNAGGRVVSDDNQSEDSRGWSLETMTFLRTLTRRMIDKGVL